MKPSFVPSPLGAGWVCRYCGRYYHRTRAFFWMDRHHVRVHGVGS
jgi:hypothetical protein